MQVVMVDALVGNDYSLCLCTSLRWAGVDVTLVVTEDRREEFPIPIDFPLKKWLPSKDSRQSKWLKALKYAQYLLKLLWYAIGNRVDVVHFQFFRLPRIESLFCVLLRLLGVNIAHTAHDVLPPEAKKIDFLFRYVIYHASNVVYVHSKYVKCQIIEKFYVRNDKIRIVPHGNFDHYLPSENMSKVTARQRFGLKNADNVLLFFGIIREYKGLDLLLEAFEIASQNNQHLWLIIAGSPITPELKKRYDAQIETLSAKERIIYHAEFIPTQQVAEYFLACDVVILPYQNIYHSGVLHLAYSFGRPVIATKVGDFPETIEHGKSGYLLEKNAVHCLSSAITTAFTAPETLLAMGQYARKLSEEHYSWHAIAKKMMHEYAVFTQ
jgi:glycosyltransferase involved in cell wall biosynthesis